MFLCTVSDHLTHMFGCHYLDQTTSCFTTNSVTGAVWDCNIPREICIRECHNLMNRNMWQIRADAEQCYLNLLTLDQANSLGSPSGGDLGFEYKRQQLRYHWKIYSPGILFVTITSWIKQLSLYRPHIFYTLYGFCFMKMPIYMGHFMKDACMLRYFIKPVPAIYLENVKSV